MPLQGEVIPFTIPSGTGAAGVKQVFHIRYPNMAAKGIVFLSVDRSGTGDLAHSSMGVDDGVRRIAAAAGATHHPFGWSTARGGSSVYSIHSEQSQAFFGGAQIRCLGYVSAIAVGSFTIQMDNNGTPGAQWYAVVIGGTGVFCQVGQLNPVTGPFTATLPFEPVALIKISSPGPNTTFEVAGANSSYGFATPCGPNQVGWGAAASTAATQSEAWLIPAEIQASPLSLATPQTVNNHYLVTGWSATGFTIGLVPGSPTSPSPALIGFLAIGGPSVGANLVPITQPGSPITVNTPVEASDPVLVFFGSVCKPAGTAAVPDYNLAWGVADGVSQVALWSGQVHNTTFMHCRASTSAAVLMATATGDATSTLNAQATCTLSPHNIGLTFQTADVVPRAIWALVLGNKSATATNCGGCISNLSLTDMTYDCPTKTLRISGSGFAPDTQITITDPLGDPVIFAITLLTPTLITAVATLTLAGEYCVSVSEPTVVAPPPGPATSCIPAGLPWPPDPPVDVLPPEYCVPLTKGCIVGAPTWFEDILIAFHATLCFDYEILHLLDINWYLKEHGMTVNRNTDCMPYPYVIECPLVEASPCGFGYQTCSDYTSAVYHNVRNNGLWFWD